MRSVIAVLALVASASCAFAADKGGPPRAADMIAAPEPVRRYSSCYLEAGTSGTVVINDSAIGLGSTQGVTLVVGAGCDREIGHRVVVGALARYGFGAVQTGDPKSIGLTFDRPWMVGARSGYILDGGTLLYGIGGVSAGEYKLTIGDASLKTHKRGWAAGAGIEMPVFSTVNFGLEYLYSDLNDKELHAHSLSATFKHRF